VVRDENVSECCKRGIRQKMFEQYHESKHVSISISCMARNSAPDAGRDDFSMDR
jgi:hypothetical protein